MKPNGMQRNNSYSAGERRIRSAARLAFWLRAPLAIPVQLVGTIRLSELMTIAVFPFRLKAIERALRDTRVLQLTLLGLLWLASQVASDLHNEVTSYNMARGCANIVVILVSFLVFASIYRDSPRAHIGYLWGSVVSGALVIVLPASSGQLSFIVDDQLWDRYVASWGLSAFALFAVYWIRRRPRLVVTIGIAYGLAGIALGGRSNGLIGLAGAMLLAYASQTMKSSARVRRVPSLAKLCSFSAIGLVPTFFVYVHLGLAGELGSLTQRQLRQAPNPYNPIYVILTARTEGPVTLHAIWDKPLLGHGSWAYSRKYDLLYEENQFAMTGHRITYNNKHHVIPCHSTILGAWLFGGVAGFFFWMYAVHLIVMRARLMIMYGNDLARVVACVFLPYTIWHVLFSPMGFARFAWPANMAFLLLTNLNNRKPYSIAKKLKSPKEANR